MVEVLQQGKMAVVSNKVCNAKNFPKLGVKIKDSMICAGDGGKTRLSGKLTLLMTGVKVIYSCRKVLENDK